MLNMFENIPKKAFPDNGIWACRKRVGKSLDNNETYKEKNQYQLK